MDWFRRADDIAAKICAKCLHSKADSIKRDGALCTEFDYIKANAAILRRSGAWRNDDPFRVFSERFFGAAGVISYDMNGGVQIAEIVNYIICKTIRLSDLRIAQHH